MVDLTSINNRVNLLAIRVRRERANVARDAGLVRGTAGCRKREREMGGEGKREDGGLTSRHRQCVG